MVEDSPPKTKKRVLVEAGAEQGSKLEMKRVAAAIRMLGSNFFQEVVTGKKEKSPRVYDHTAYSVEEMPETEEAHVTFQEDLDEEMLESMSTEDDDAALVLQLENAIIDTVQEDAELAAFFSSYQEARKRLAEKVRARGFWNASGKGQKGGGKRPVKGKFGGKNRGFKPLSQRIAESYCKRCLRKGHWKAECPNPSASEGSSNQTTPTSFVVDVELNPEIASIPEMSIETNLDVTGAS